MTDGNTHHEYAKHSELMTPMGVKVEALIRDVITSQGITVHSIGHRMKSESSTEAKLTGNPGKYATCADLHDFLGLRVITHLAGDVAPVVAAVRAQFTVDEERSLDKQSQLDADRFGYRSFHLVVKIDNARATLPEWAPYVDREFEIQVRSILQHAWAEIEHDLGYKATSVIPQQVRRRFARLAGLLEIADSEFDAIASALDDHIEEVSSEMQHGRSVAIDAAAVAFLIEHDVSLRQIDKTIAAGLGTALEKRASKRYVDSMTRHLVRAGFKSTDEVAEALRDSSPAIARFAIQWITTDLKYAPPLRDGDRYSPGIGLFYLAMHGALIDPGTDFFEDLHKIQYQLPLLRDVHDQAFREMVE